MPIAYSDRDLHVYLMVKFHEMKNEDIGVISNLRFIKDILIL